MGMKKTAEERAEIVARALRTGKMANTLAKALATRYAYRWRFVDFRGSKGEESAGVVDIVAIRKSSKKPNIEGLKELDLFDIILIQVKGGKAARPSSSDVERLKLVGREYKAKAIVLFEWNKEKGISRFLKLDESIALPNDQWGQATAAKLFGRPAKSKKDDET